MEFTNETLEVMQDRLSINKQYSKWLYGMSLDDNVLGVDRYYNLSERLNNCLDLWLWDKYEKNKLLDLQKVNRCMNNKFCPNCRRFSLASAIHNFKSPFQDLLNQGYNPYLMSLTIPNVKGDKLRDTIKFLNTTFRKFFQKLSQPVGLGEKGFSERLMTFDAALKVLEITYNYETDEYHPHFHIIIFSKEYDESLFVKDIKGPWSNKKQDYLYNSLMDIHIMQIWKMCVDNIRMSVKNFENMSSNWYDLYLCDIREMDSNGIYEVLKYTFKDTDIVNYKVFKTMFTALDGQRIRQGHGLLFNIKVEDIADGEKQDIEDYLIEKENPEQLLTREIKTLTTVYSGFRKISRFRSMEELNNLD